MVMKMKCSVCVTLMMACVGLSEATLVSWDGTSTDITDLAANVSSTGSQAGIWSASTRAVAAVGSQAGFKAALGNPDQRQAIEINAGFDQIFVGGNESSGSSGPYVSMMGFDTSAFGAAEVLTTVSLELKNRTWDTMSVRWFVEAGGSTYVSAVVGTVTPTLTTLTLPDATDIEWFAFDKDLEIGPAGATDPIGASAGTLSLTDVDYVGYHASSAFTSAANWRGAYVNTFSATAGSPLIAKHPHPADGATGVDAIPTLSWTPGDFVQALNEHDVYFGETFDDVNNATKASHPNVTYLNRDVNNFDPGSLEL